MNIVLDKQLRWARRSGIQADAKGYVDKLDANLWRPLDERSRVACEADDLRDRMRALHSAPALVANFFDYWILAERSPLEIALGTRSAITGIAFEARHEPGLPGAPTHLDVCITLDGGHTLGIDSSFGEWLASRRAGKEAFKAAYFDQQPGLWAAAGLPRCQALAQRLRDRQVPFFHLDAPQLLKHALVLARRCERAFSLLYLYYEWDVPQSARHRQEIEQFEALLDPELAFRALTYQEAFARLVTAANPADRTYLTYLAQRYFGHGTAVG